MQIPVSPIPLPPVSIRNKLTGGGLGSARQSGRSPPSSSGSQQDEAIRDMFLQDIKNSGHPISAEFLAQFESAGAGGGSSSRSSSGREHSQHQEGGGGGSTRRRVGSAPPASRGSRALSVATERQPVEDCGVPNNTEVHLPGKSQGVGQGPPKNAPQLSVRRQSPRKPHNIQSLPMSEKFRKVMLGEALSTKNIPAGVPRSRLKHQISSKVNSRVVPKGDEWSFSSHVDALRSRLESRQRDHKW